MLPLAQENPDVAFRARELLESGRGSVPGCRGGGATEIRCGDVRGRLALPFLPSVITETGLDIHRYICSNLFGVPLTATGYLSPGSITTKSPPHPGGLVVYIPPLHHTLTVCPTAISTGSPSRRWIGVSARSNTQHGMSYRR